MVGVSGNYIVTEQDDLPHVVYQGPLIEQRLA